MGLVLEGLAKPNSRCSANPFGFINMDHYASSSCGKSFSCFGQLSRTFYVSGFLSYYFSSLVCKARKAENKGCLEK